MGKHVALPAFCHFSDMFAAMTNGFRWATRRRQVANNKRSHCPPLGFLMPGSNWRLHLRAILYAVIAEGIGQDRDAARHRASPVLVCGSHGSKGIVTICGE